MAKTVLIVEDNELNMKLFRDLLEAHGYQTSGTSDGFEALNLVRNAVQAIRGDRRDKGRVLVTARAEGDGAAIEIDDDGPGFPLQLLGRLGEPYLSTRAGATDHMGLGIFIAQSLLERSGAQLAFDNLPDGGAHVAISWNRANLETVDQIRQPATAAPAQR